MDTGHPFDGEQLGWVCRWTLDTPVRWGAARWIRLGLRCHENRRSGRSRVDVPRDRRRWLLPDNGERDGGREVLNTGSVDSCVVLDVTAAGRALGQAAGT